VAVKVRVRSGRRAVETSALANTGFESDREEVLLPVRLAERLGEAEEDGEAAEVALGPSRPQL